MIRPGKNTCGRGVPHQKAMVQCGGSPGQTPSRKGVSHNWVSSCLVSPSLVSGAMKAYRHYYNRNTATHTTIYTWGLQEAASSTSPSETGSEEEEDLCPTPPLFNGHAITNGVDSSTTDVPIEEEIASTEDSHSDHDIHGREGFRSLLEVYKREGTPKKEFRAQTPLSDEEDLAGVNVRKLRVSYLNAAQEKHAQEENQKTSLSTGVNITNLVGAYSSPVPRAATPSSRPDDLTPVSLRSLKSAYEATATGTSSAGSRHGSSSCSSPVGGSPAPKEELNISLHQLREEYCRSVLEGDSRSNTPTKAPPETGVSIRQLTRSMTDLTTVGQDTHTSVKDDDRSVLATVNVKALTRSFTDLTRLSEPVMPPNRMTRPRYDTAPASVSVKPLCSTFVGPSPPLPTPALRRNISTGLSLNQRKAVYLNRDDILEKHVGPRVRSFDASKMKNKFEKPKQVSQMPTECKQCGKQVFQMERIVAERAAWHKNCFRCTECNTILTLETYQSHEGVLYCKPHFRDLFRPKAVVEDPMEARKDRTTDRPDYGLEELSTANVRQKFAMFEQAAQEDELQADPAQIRRSNSLLNRAAKFMYGEDDDYGIENSELGDYEEDEEDEDEDQEEAGEGEEGEDGDPDAVKTKKKKKITRPVSFAGMEDLKRQRNRRDEMRKRRNQELSQFRQMLCAGKNISTREMFESGSLDGQNDKNKRPEQINIEGRPATKNLRERFEKGELGGSLDDQKEVDEVFRNSETASKARNLFKQMESGEGQENDERATTKPRENRLSKEGCDDEEVADFYGRDPNLVKYTDNLEEPLDCRKTKSVLAMFRKMEMQEGDDEKGPRPLKRFTPPPEGEYDDSDDEEYSDEEYSDEEDEEDEDEDEEEESDEDDERPRKPKYKDEILEMAKSSQSARKAASLRAKFERWESEVEHNNEYNRNERNEDDEECMPSIDTARNLRAMFENKAQEASRPVVSSQPKLKVNRFVGGGGDKCLSCDRTVYAMERLEVAGRVLHKNCFKCCKCSTKLSMNSFSIGGEDIYCMTHYKQAFTEKGTYDVFTPNKGKWTRKIEATSSELAKSQE